MSAQWRLKGVGAHTGALICSATIIWNSHVKRTLAVLLITLLQMYFMVRANRLILQKLVLPQNDFTQACSGCQSALHRTKWKALDKSHCVFIVTYTHTEHFYALWGHACLIASHALQHMSAHQNGRIFSACLIVHAVLLWRLCTICLP